LQAPKITSTQLIITKPYVPLKEALQTLTSEHEGLDNIIDSLKLVKHLIRSTTHARAHEAMWQVAGLLLCVVAGCACTQGVTHLQTSNFGFAPLSHWEHGATGYGLRNSVSFQTPVEFTGEAIDLAITSGVHVVEDGLPHVRPATPLQCWRAPYTLPDQLLLT
jgi:hypothetical protein